MEAPNHDHSGESLEFMLGLYSNRVTDLQSMWFWESHLTGLFLSFLICEIGLILIIFILQGCCKN